MTVLFSFKRWGLLLHNHLIENKKKYYLFTGSITAIGILMVLLYFIFGQLNDYNCYCMEGNPSVVTFKNVNTDWQVYMTVVYWVGLFLFGGMFALNSFVNFGNSGEAIFYLNKPASILEKWLLEVVVRVVLFYIVYTGIFFITFGTANVLVNQLEAHAYREFYATHVYSLDLYTDFCSKGGIPEFSSTNVYLPWRGITIDEDVEPQLLQVLHASLIAGIGFFMYGAVIFNRFSFFKTFLLGFGLFIFYVLYLYFLHKNGGSIFVDYPWQADVVDSTAYHRIQNNLYIEIDMKELMPVYYFLLFFIPSGLLSLSYLALKEKQI